MASAKPSVLVGLSGGVDSAVAAALLAEEGHRVSCALLGFKPVDDCSVGWCCGDGAQDDARAAADQLGLPLEIVDCSARFEREILEPAWNEYARGRTPSPCILCNERIKFQQLLELADTRGIQHISTGHFARLDHTGTDGAPRLKRGADANKDQSYFLFSLTDEQLSRTVFPLGALTKGQVRARAAELGLPNAERPESQDACFMSGERAWSEDLRLRFEAPSRPGAIVDPRGNQLGEHAGVHLYTIGQRKGLGVALGRRAYVSRIDAESGEVELSTSEDALLSASLEASGLRWIDPAPRFPRRLHAQIRYRHEASPATVEQIGPDRIFVAFDERQKAITPGQAVVLYDGDAVVGGGWIE